MHSSRALGGQVPQTTKHSAIKLQINSLLNDIHQKGSDGSRSTKNSLKPDTPSQKLTSSKMMIAFHKKCSSIIQSTTNLGGT